VTICAPNITLINFITYYIYWVTTSYESRDSFKFS